MPLPTWCCIHAAGALRLLETGVVVYGSCMEQTRQAYCWQPMPRRPALATRLAFTLEDV